MRIILRQCGVLAMVAVAVFLLMKASPVDPVEAYLGAAMSKISPEQKAQIAASWGLEQPLYQQFMAWLSQILRGNFGYSTSYNAPVAQILLEKGRASLLLAGLAWAASGFLGFGLGVCAAYFSGRWIDKVICFYCYILSATPSFWLGAMMIALFSVSLGWTPICCADPIGILPEEISLAQRALHLLLPLTILTLFGLAQITLHSRQKVLEVLSSDYVLMAKAQGATGFDILTRHVVRNAALPGLTILMASSTEILGGTILAEQLFAWPGLGRASVEAGIKGDVALLMAVALLSAILVSSANLLADRLSRKIDPRMAIK